MQFGIGQSVQRKEDPRFLTGRGQYVSDINLANQTHAVFIYSTHAHAEIKSIDTKNWREDTVQNAGPMAVWDILAQKLEDFVERHE